MDGFNEKKPWWESPKGKGGGEQKNGGRGCEPWIGRVPLRWQVDTAREKSAASVAREKKKLERALDQAFSWDGSKEGRGCGGNVLTEHLND